MLAKGVLGSHWLLLFILILFELLCTILVLDHLIICALISGMILGTNMITTKRLIRSFDELIILHVYGLMGLCFVLNISHVAGAYKNLAHAVHPYDTVMSGVWSFTNTNVSLVEQSYYNSTFLFFYFLLRYAPENKYKCGCPSIWILLGSVRFYYGLQPEHTYGKSNKTILNISGFLQNGGVWGV